MFIQIMCKAISIYRWFMRHV